MLGCGVQWGTIGEWVGGIAAAGALGITAWIAWSSRKLNAEQGALIAEQRREIASEAASRMSALRFTESWDSALDAESGLVQRTGVPGLDIVNGTDAVIRQVIVTANDPPSDEVPLLIREDVTPGQRIHVALTERQWYASIVDAAGHRWTCSFRDRIPVAQPAHGSPPSR